MQWEELLEEFRAIGGVAENVRLGAGARGRGLFVIDPAKPASLHIPRAITIPVSAVGTDSGDIRVDRDQVDDRVATFYEHYQKHFGWSAGGREEAFALQREWHDLPPEIVNFIKTMGVLDHPELRFMPPDDRVLLEEHVRARVFADKTGSFMIPMIDLVNHLSTARGYVTDGGVGVSGTFADEVLVRYNNFDPMTMALHYGFADQSVFACSIGITLDLPGGRRLTIAREISASETRDGIAFPVVTETDGHLRFSHLMLGIMSAPDVPRAIFRSLVKPYVDPVSADQIFDGIAHFNRVRFINLLRTLRKYDGRLVRALQDTSINQLEALSYCVGARAL